jgi:outer membrane receptor protein involved in Fe transport
LRAGAGEDTPIVLEESVITATKTESDTHKTHAVNLDATQELLTFDAVTFVYGLNLSYDLVDSTKIGGHDRVSGGLFLESPIYATLKRTFTPAARFDVNTDFPAVFDFKLSAVYALGSKASLKTSIAKSYRTPTLNDLYRPYEPAFGIGAEITISNRRPVTVLTRVFPRYIKTGQSTHSSSPGICSTRSTGIRETTAFITSRMRTSPSTWASRRAGV